MKKHIWSVLLAACLLFTLIPAARAAEGSFSDVNTNAWYADEIRWAAENDLMGGVGGTSFAPDSSTSRAMIWTILARLSGADVDGGTPWYAKAQDWAMANGVSDGTNPDGIITRQELVTMLYRYVGSPDVSNGSLAAMSAYSDSASVSSWAQEAMAWGVSKGLVSGVDGSLQPQSSATRAQTAVVLYRVDEKEIVNVSGKEPEQKPAEKPEQKPAAGDEVYIPVHYHSWGTGTVTTPATCAAEGVMTYTCLCGVTKTEAIAIDSSAHAWGSLTCNGDGTHSRTCGNDASHLDSASCSGSTCVCGQSYVAQVGDKCYETLQAAIEAAESGTVKLLADVDLAETVTVAGTVTLDLNGMTIDNTTDIWDTEKRAYALITVANEGKLTVTGGTMAAKENDCYAFCLDGGDLVIKDGSYVGNVSVVYVIDGTATIENGEFSLLQKATDGSSKFLLNCLDAAYQSGDAKIIVSGGTFEGFNPADNASEGANTDLTADGYTGVQVDGKWSVLEGVSTLNELNAAVKESQEEGESVKLQADITVTDVNERIFMTNNGVLEGNKHTVTYGGGKTASGYSAGVVNTTGGTIQNLTVVGGENGRAIYTTGLTADLYVINCELSGAYSFNANTSKGSGDPVYSLHFEDTIFRTWVSYGTGVKSASFTDCIFGAYLRPYCDTTLIGCVFADGAVLNATTDVKNITLKDCYLGDVLITEDNVSSLFEKDDTYTGTVVVVANTVIEAE